MKEIHDNIQIIINPIETDVYFTGKIRPGGTSSRINLPPKYAGMRAIVVIIDKVKP